MTADDNHNKTGLYFLIFAALWGLTALTVGVAFIDLGGLNGAAAVAIAAVKASLVAAVFMHVRGGPPLTKAAIAAGCIWLAILMGLTMSDFATRSW